MEVTPEAYDFLNPSPIETARQISYRDLPRSTVDREYCEYIMAGGVRKDLYFTTAGPFPPAIEYKNLCVKLLRKSRARTKQQEMQESKNKKGKLQSRMNVLLSNRRPVQKKQNDRKME